MTFVMTPVDDDNGSFQTAVYVEHESNLKAICKITDASVTFNLCEEQSELFIETFKQLGGTPPKGDEPYPHLLDLFLGDSFALGVLTMQAQRINQNHCEVILHSKEKFQKELYFYNVALHATRFIF